ncbi:MAG: hypothetical protein WBS24_07825 [Terriglobales bacterium]
MKRLFAALTLAILSTITAHAAISEIRKDFLNLTSLLPATPFISAPGATASYLVCVYLTQPGSENAMTAVLRWTDENSSRQSFTFATPSGPVNFCNPIRNHAATAPTIETDGAYPGSYELFVTGFGFWPTGAQSQGGVTEPIHRQLINGFNGTLLTPVATGDYLFAIALSNGGVWTLNWTDSIGPQTMTSSTAPPGAFPIHVVAASEITFSGGALEEPAYVDAIHFGAPSTGSGPLTDYELNLLNYTDVTWPNKINVLTNTTPGMYVFAGNMARVPGEGGPAAFELWGDSLPLQILDITPSGAPGTNDTLAPPIGIVGAGYRNGSVDNPFSFNVSTAINYGTSYPGWGSVAPYSAEVDVIKF